MSGQAASGIQRLVAAGAEHLEPLVGDAQRTQRACHCLGALLRERLVAIFGAALVGVAPDGDMQ